MECLVGDSRGSACQSGNGRFWRVQESCGSVGQSSLGSSRICEAAIVNDCRGSLGMSEQRLSSQCLPCLVLSCVGNHRARAVYPPRPIQKGAAMNVKQKITAYMNSYRKNKQYVKDWKKKRGEAHVR